MPWPCNTQVRAFAFGAPTPYTRLPDDDDAAGTGAGDTIALSACTELLEYGLDVLVRVPGAARDSESFQLLRALTSRADEPRAKDATPSGAKTHDASVDEGRQDASVDEGRQNKAAAPAARPRPCRVGRTRVLFRGGDGGMQIVATPRTGSQASPTAGSQARHAALPHAPVRAPSRCCHQLSWSF